MSGIQHRVELTYQNLDTFVPLNGLGNPKFSRDFLPTYNYNGEFINERHAFFNTCPVDGLKIDIGIRGSLRKQDALKLYELAYFSERDILELGCSHGLSTSIMAEALRDSGSQGGKHIDTVDLVQKCTDHTMITLEGMGLGSFVQAHCGDAIALCDQLLEKGRRYSFVFVDHSHAYDLVYQATKRIVKLLTPGGLCLFHDFNDRRNLDPTREDYGVAQGAVAVLEPAKFEFYGIYGCTALYRKPL